MTTLKRQYQSLFPEIRNHVLSLPPTSAHYPTVALLTPADPYLSGHAPSGAAAATGPAVFLKASSSLLLKRGCLRGSVMDGDVQSQVFIKKREFLIVLSEAKLR